MLPLGHLGMVLLLFAPIGYALRRRRLEGNLAAGVAAVLLLTLTPDIDLYTPVFVHRGLTHTFIAAVALGSLTAFLWRVSNHQSLGNPVEQAVFGFLVGWTSVVGHLLGDIITPMGIQPFLPLDSTVYTLSLVGASNRSANITLFAGGILLLVASIKLAERSLPTGEDTTDNSLAEPSVGSDTKLG